MSFSVFFSVCEYIAKTVRCQDDMWMNRSSNSAHDKGKIRNA
ncbi:hypothetical protein CLOSTHATH_03845 [Hungatella hathewayi DSM 13479]|uniref:Uncharacterized protein n=1 Tax=Hungatella hathewayi DSM 13479 TaxID=566550 RepID=D3AJQ4_9FIRM|nr:hypothetical protein CLOSTHATH_03845 [Hungatella hathewayi DSM 13479]